MGISLPVLWILGLALCAIAGGQFAFWSSLKFRDARRSGQNFQDDQQRLRTQIRESSTRLKTSLFEQTQRGETWQGYRHFVVDRLVKETETTTSVYLIPADRKSIAPFRPGQHITLRLNIPSQAKPIIRCYSLSDSPDKPYYRISVKVVPPAPNRPDLSYGKASHYIHHGLSKGQIVDVKAPAGEFMLHEDSNRLIVMLAGGIGITPMISMLNHLAGLSSERTTLLVYGVRDGADHPFSSMLQGLVKGNSNLHVVTCYSEPRTQDKQGFDFQVAGRVSIGLLQQMLSQPDAEFYLCGPPAFMKSLNEGLLAWGADSSDIRFEAFGPASISQENSTTVEPSRTGDMCLVKFARSGMTLQNNGHQTLLELAESLNLPVDSGCRVGSCGTCRAALLSGEVEYPVGQKIDCPKGQCLLCIARPRGEVELDV